MRKGEEGGAVIPTQPVEYNGADIHGAAHGIPYATACACTLEETCSSGRAHRGRFPGRSCSTHDGCF